MYRDLKLPPEPVLRRWGTCIHAALFYRQHWNTKQIVVKTSDSSDASAIFIAKNVLSAITCKKCHL